MTPEKRNKIKAMLNNPASTENEKSICRKILNIHFEQAPSPLGGAFHSFQGDAGAAAQTQRDALRNEIRNQQQRRILDLLRKRK